MALSRTLTLKLSKDEEARLKKLADTTESSTTEVIANALKLYEHMIEREQAGDAFFVQPKGGIKGPFRPFGP